MSETATLPSDPAYYTQYKNWEAVTLPNGHVLYIVPDSGVAYDPFMSQVKGRPVLWNNPKTKLAQQQTAQSQQEELVKAQKQALSPQGQALPILGGVAGTVGGAYLIKQALGPTATGMTANGGTVLMSDGSQIVNGVKTIPSVAGAAPTAQGAFNTAVGGSAAAPQAVVAGGGDLAATGELAPVAAEAPGMFSLGGVGSAGNVLLPAAGALGGYDLLTHDRGPGMGALEGAASGAALGSYFGPPGAVVGGIAGGVIGLGKGLSEHESTREVTAKRTNSLLSASNDPTYQGYVQGMREQFKAAPADPKKPYHGGQFGSWDEYKAAGLDPTDLTGVYGNIDTFGPEWANLTQDQRQAVTKGIIDADLYHPDRGDVVISDKDAARKIKDNILGGGKVEPITLAPTGPVAPISQATPVPRTATRSPGIDLNGRRLTANEIGLQLAQRINARG